MFTMKESTNGSARTEFPRISSDGVYLKFPCAGYVITQVSCLSSMYAARGELSRMLTIVIIGMIRTEDILSIR